ncbi:MAG: hypothetical protein JWM32_2557 [Verrucomicrobia bacterium]|nr:hypothetical protein [Verrucomicrobiota bacterium]
MKSKRSAPKVAEPGLIAGMSFVRFRVWEVVVPGRADIVSAAPHRGLGYSGSVTWAQEAIHLVEGETAGGLVALGESGRGQSAAMIESTLRGLLGVALDRATPASLWSTPNRKGGLPPSFPLHSWEATEGRSLALMETLWLDAMGKAAGVPAHVLFGGAVRDRVAVDFWANRPNTKTLIRLVREAVDRGCSGMKLKCDGFGDTVESLVEAAPDVPPGFRFTLDPMCAWRTFRESWKLAERLHAAGLAVQIEDPFPHAAIEDWRRLRAALPIPLIWHARDEATLRLGLRERVADGYNLGCVSGYEFRQFADVTAFEGFDCWQGSSLELGVIQAARLHAAATAKNCVIPSDLQSVWVRESTLVTPTMEIRDGFARVSNRPGLGVELDRRALARYTRRHWEVR